MFATIRTIRARTNKPRQRFFQRVRHGSGCPEGEQKTWRWRILSGTFSLTRHTFVQFACFWWWCTLYNNKRLSIKIVQQKTIWSQLYIKALHEIEEMGMIRKIPSHLVSSQQKGGIEKSMKCWGLETSNTCLFSIKLNTCWVSNVITFKSIYDSSAFTIEKYWREKAQYVIVQSKEGKKSTLIELFDWSRELALTKCKCQDKTLDAQIQLCIPKKNRFLPRNQYGFPGKSPFSLDSSLQHRKTQNS